MNSRLLKKLWWSKFNVSDTSKVSDTFARQNPSPFLPSLFFPKETRHILKMAGLSNSTFAKFKALILCKKSKGLQEFSPLLVAGLLSSVSANKILTFLPL